MAMDQCVGSEIHQTEQASRSSEMVDVGMACVEHSAKQHSTHAQHGHGTCNHCAVCCIAAALPATSLPLDVNITTTEDYPALTTGEHSIDPTRLDRPPRPRFL